MKVEYKELKKSLDYIAKNSDQGDILIDIINPGTAFTGLKMTFQDLSKDEITLLIYSNPEIFSKITKTERF